MHHEPTPGAKIGAIVGATVGVIVGVTHEVVL